MKLHVSVRSSDPNVASEIAQMKIEGVTIKKSLTIREIVKPPIDFLVYIGEHVVLPIVVSLIARKLYDILKGRKDNKLTIQNQSVEINTQKIEQLILISLKEKEE